MFITKSKYEILFPTEQDEINRINKRLELVGRNCYKSEDKITDSPDKFLSKIIKNKHLSILEHGHMSMRVICSRSISHQIVRHRLFSFAQESQRYVKYNQIVFIKPHWFSEELYEKLKDLEITYLNFDTITSLCNTCDFTAEYGWLSSMLQAEQAYTQLINNNKSPQEARGVLPNSCKTDLIMTGNLRQWRYFLELRTGNGVDPELLEITTPMLTELQQHWPIVFDNI